MESFVGSCILEQVGSRSGATLPHDQTSLDTEQEAVEPEEDIQRKDPVDDGPPFCFIEVHLCEIQIVVVVVSRETVDHPLAEVDDGEMESDGRQECEAVGGLAGWGEREGDPVEMETERDLEIDVDDDQNVACEVYECVDVVPGLESLSAFLGDAAEPGELGEGDAAQRADRREDEQAVESVELVPRWLIDRVHGPEFVDSQDDGRGHQDPVDVAIYEERVLVLVDPRQGTQQQSEHTVDHVEQDAGQDA